MSELKLLEETLDELFARELKYDADPAAMWQRLEEAGLTLAGVSEEAGGGGGGLDEAALVVRVAGRHAAPGPIAETGLLAGWLLAAAGLAVPEGPLTAAAGDSLTLRRDGDGWLLDGAARRVPWARAVEWIAVLAGGQVALVPVERATLSLSTNLAGEPRDTVAFDRVRIDAAQVGAVAGGIDAEAFECRGALARAAAIAGALERVLELTVRYAGEREQFGRPIGRFQAVQHEIALLAGEVVAARAAVDAAIERPDPLHVASAKIRTGEAATRATEIAHQVPGALGFTQEYRLHRFTLRLWAWRDEFGSEEQWARTLGEQVAAGGGDELWPLLTATERERE